MFQIQILIQSVVDEPRRLRIELGQDSPIAIIGNTEIELRRYGNEVVGAFIKPEVGLDPVQATMKLVTVTQNGPWPVGPELTLAFRIHKPRWRFILMLAIAMAVGPLITVGSGLFRDNPSLSVLFGMLAGILWVLANLIYFGKPPSSIGLR